MKLRPKVKPGGWCWLIMATQVSAMDFWLIYKQKSTMSEVFGAALRHPLRRWPIILSWTILTLHLFSCIMPIWMTKLKHIDPIGIAARGLNHHFGYDIITK